MSCHPSCPVPDFLFPKGSRNRQKIDCIEKCDDPQCTAYQLYAINPQKENCMNARMAELMRCHACQEEAIKRLIANQHNQYQCDLQKYTHQGPEIPFLCKPEPTGKFIRYGYTKEDCFPHNVRKDACAQRSAWKKKVKTWIKDLNEHYNSKVTSDSEKPIEDYIRLNLNNLCVSCRAKEEQSCGPPQIKPGCIMVSSYCGKCKNGKLK